MMPILIANLLGDADAMGREKYRRALRGERTKQILQLACAFGIHPHHGFVDDENPRFVYQRRANDESLLHAVRVTLHQLVFPPNQLEALQQFKDAPFKTDGIDTMKLADEFQEFEPAEFLINERTVRDETGDRFGLFRLPFHVVAAQENLAGCGLEDSHHDTNGRRLTRAIGSEKAKDLALR